MVAFARADVCIIGAGLAGALMAYELGRAGLKVTMLDAGPRPDPKDRFARMERHLNEQDPWASELPERDGYTNAGEIDFPLRTMRVKAVGGTTHHWGGTCLRLHESDFRMRSRYGIADDWPISYAELEPYYVRAEAALGVAGTADNPYASYRSADYPLPPFPFSYANRIFKPRLDRIGVTLHHVPFARNSRPYQGRPACQAYSTCHPVCPIEAMYNAGVHIRLAEQTGNVRVIPNANVVRLVESGGKVTEAIYASPDRTEHTQPARLFILAAHAIESARLLLLSRSGRFPDGMANDSGLVGRNFMSHLKFQLAGKLDLRLFPYRIGFHTGETHHFYTTRRRDRVGAFKLEIDDRGPTPSQIADRSGNWGRALADEVADAFGRHAAILAMVEQLPDRRNAVTLDPEVTDCFGNPVPRIHYAISDYERETLRVATARIEHLLQALGAREVEPKGEPIGFSSHHLGTCRMGDDPERSVVDRNLKAHALENLYVVGSGAFVTGGAVNPSLTIAALAIRAAGHVLNDPSAEKPV